MNETKQFWGTSDLGIAASILSLGYELIDIDDTDSRRLVFCFAGDDGLDAIASAYRSGELLVSALAYSDSLRSLKGAIRRAREQKKMEDKNGRPSNFER